MKRGIYVGGLCLLTGGAGITLFLTQRANRDLTAQVHPAGAGSNQ